jgi:transposase
MIYRNSQYIAKVFVDGGYTGTLIEWAKQVFGYTVEVVKRRELHQFKVLPKRWIVERSLAWLNWSAACPRTMNCLTPRPKP